MVTAQPKFRREPSLQRRRSLIEATLSIITHDGPEAATSRAIAAEAKVTQGLIRHYFASKDELIEAAFELHMTQITTSAINSIEGSTDSRKEQLRAFIVASLSGPTMDPVNARTWAAFMYLVQRNPRMRDVHQNCHMSYRNRLQALIASAMEEAGRIVPSAELLRLSIASNAVIDGLWLEGGASPENFEEGELPSIGLAAIGAIMSLDLSEPG